MWNNVKKLLFKNTSTRQTVAKNTFWLAVSNVGGRLTRAVIIIYSARVLGAAEWGIFSYAVSLVGFVSVFTDIGISPILVRETAKSREDPERQRKILSTSFYLKVFLLALGVLAVIFIAPRFMSLESPSVSTVLVFVTFILAFDTMREFGFSLIRALEKMEWEAGLYLLTNLAIVVTGFAALYLSRSVVSFTFAYALGTGIGMMATIFILWTTFREKIRGLFFSFSKKLMWYVLESAWPFAISSFLGVLLINTDILIIGWLRSAEDVGLYSAGQRVVQLLYLLPSIINTSLLPTFSRLAGKDDQKLRSTLEGVLAFVFLIAIPLSLGGLILGKEIIGFLFGGGYVKAALPFQVLMLTMLIDFPTVILSSMIFAYDKQKNLMIYSAIGGVSNVIFDLLFIPRFGIAGSAIATLSAQFLGQIYLRHTAKKVNYFVIAPHLKKIFTAAAVMMLPLLLLKLAGAHVLLTIVVSAAVYLGVLLFLKEPIVREAKLILRAGASAAPEESVSLS
ncbi:MAG: flippase [Candidatus Liptonbacteria bacterium]|nr:flippase [Candidatus Liptonbacteria bacterium]